VEIQQVQSRAVQQRQPVVNELVHTASRDVQQIEQALGGLLDFCGYASGLELYRRLCRHYWDMDPAATAFYVQAYRERWDSEGGAFSE